MLLFVCDRVGEGARGHSLDVRAITATMHAMVTLPRFTLRAAILAITLGALVALVVREALLGRAWGIAALVGLGSLAASFALQGLLFLASLAVSRDADAPRGRGNQ